MEKNTPLPYPLYDSSYGSEFPAEQYFLVLFNTLPSRFTTNMFYEFNVTNYFISIGFKKVSQIQATNRRFDFVSQSLYVHHEKQIFVKMFGSVEKNKPNYAQLEFIYNIENGEFENQFDFVKIKEYERLKKKSNINLVKTEMGHMDIEEYDLNIPDMDLELNYGKSFLKIHNSIIERLNKPSDKGIILLHGEPGTGKTSYIKYLTSLIIDKDILFIPPSMAEMLSEPSIIPFLMDHKNSILIIEDAERVISDRELNGSSSGVSNILNLTDGILGDCLSIQVIATFNMKREKIDRALLRKGRLIAEHKFDKLNVEDTNILLRHLNKNYVSKEKMCLADIYNVDLEVYKSENNYQEIGFK